MGKKQNNTQQESSDKKKSRVYYGEYSLEYWIELMMKRKIVLPEYQRCFVWKEHQVKAFIDSLKKGLYVPPVTLGLCESKNAKKNIIIDGQQRLTSLMLAYFNVFPKIDKFGKSEKDAANDNDDRVVEEHSKILEWEFEKLLENEAKSKEQVMENISEEDYSKLDITIEPDFFKKTCLGFTYIVPYSTLNKKEQARYYSSVFRNINIQGTALSKMESRKSLYFLDNNFSGLFCPNFEQQVMINNQHIDFVRYLAFASQYSRQGNADELAKHYGGNIERYYEDFIYFFINEKESGAYDNIFKNHSEVFTNKKEQDARVAKMKQLYEDLKLPKNFTSIIPADLHLMGLVYYVIFEGNDIDIKQQEDLRKELGIAEKESMDDENHRKSPAKLKHLRWRMSKSVEIYSKYVI